MDQDKALLEEVSFENNILKQSLDEIKHHFLRTLEG